MPLLTTPYRYQEKGISWLQRFNLNGLLADEMGLGKSLQALGCADAASANTLILCPASLKWNWEREVRTHLGFRPNVLEGKSKKSAHATWAVSFTRCTIINYDILDYWLPMLMEKDFDMLIMDEAHCLVNRGTKRYKNVKFLSKTMRWKLALTGTPIVNYPAELWSILNIIQPDRYKSFWSFAAKYCKSEMKPWGWVHTGVNKKTLPELHEDLEDNVMVRRLKSDVMSQLPPIVRTVLPMPLSNRKEYKIALDNFLLWMEKEYGRAKMLQASKAERLTQIGYLLRLAGIGKLPSVFEWIDNFMVETTGKLIGFAVHKSVIGQLEARYKDKCVVVNGDTSSRGRMEAVDQFNSDKSTRLFLGNIKAAGTGLNLRASTLAFFELPWTPGAVAQCEARAHGINRGVEGETTMVNFLVAKSTIEEKLCKIIQEKQATARIIMDGGEMPDDLDLFNQLIDELRKAG